MLLNAGVCLHASSVEAQRHLVCSLTCGQRTPTATQLIDGLELIHILFPTPRPINGSEMQSSPVLSRFILAVLVLPALGL